ncbi:MAG: GNAT family N-acetyltransferase [Arcanobacterium sp.]
MAHYRPLELSDLPEVKTIIADTFNASSYAPDAPTLARAMDLMWNVIGAESTFAQVAVIDGKIVGLVIVGIPNARPLVKPVQALIAILKNTALLLTIHGKHARSLIQYLRILYAYNRLAKRGSFPQAEVKVFAILPQYRGQGMGSQLFAQARTYLANTGHDDMFLYTDNMCTWQFYEKRQMNRITETTIHLNARGLPRDFEIYVYEGPTNAK